MAEPIKGIKCPLCDKEALVPIEHLYESVALGIRWFHCEECDKDLCKDRLSNSWKIAAYDIDIPEKEEKS